MATVTKVRVKGGIKWKALVRKGGKSRSKTFHRKTEARAWAERIEKDVEVAIALGSPGACIRVDELAEECIADWTGKDRNFPSRVNWWVERIGVKNLIDVDAALIRHHLEDYAAGKARRYDGIGKNLKPKTIAMDRPRKPATVNRCLAALSAIFSFARRKGYITRNPCADVASLPENNKIVRWLSDDERARLLAACRGSAWSRLYLIVVLALSSGMRRSEMLRMRWSDINFKDRHVFLGVTKNGEQRLVTLPPSTMRLLEDYREVGNGLVFPGKQRINRPIQFRAYWLKAIEQSGVKNFRFHDLRHSAASYLAMQGCSLIEIAQILGHKNIQTTQRYAHLSIDHQRTVVDRVLGNLEGENGDD